MKKKFFFTFVAIVILAFSVYTVAKVKNQNKVLKNELKIEREYSAKISDQLVKEQDINRNAKNDILTLSEDMKILNTEKEKLNEEIIISANRHEQQLVSLGSQEKMVASSRVEADKIQEAFNRMQNQATNDRKIKVDLEKNLAETQKQLKEAQEEVLKFQELLKSNGQQIETIVEKPAQPNSQQLAQVAQLKLEADKSRAEINHLQEQIAVDYQRLAEIKRNLALASILLEKNSNMTEDIIDLKVAYERLNNILKSQIENKNLEISYLNGELKLVFPSKSIFVSGGANLNTEGKRLLELILINIKTLPNIEIKTIAHTDNQAVNQQYQRYFPTNWELSAAQAGAVLSFFAANTDINPDFLKAFGRSSYEPIASNDDLEGREKNSRLELIIKTR